MNIYSYVLLGVLALFFNILVVENVFECRNNVNILDTRANITGR